MNLQGSIKGLVFSLGVFDLKNSNKKSCIREFMKSKMVSDMLNSNTIEIEDVDFKRPKVIFDDFFLTLTRGLGPMIALTHIAREPTHSEKKNIGQLGEIRDLLTNCSNPNY